MKTSTSTLNERIAQARRTHRFALGMTTICSCPAVVSAVLIAVGQPPTDSIVTALPVITCLQFTRESDARLDKLLSELKEEDDA
jgi:hypothetical protein